MDTSGFIHDKLKWLDEDRDLDLTLNKYHARSSNPVLGSTPQNKQSFRRTLSLSSASMGRRPTLKPHRKLPNSSQSAGAHPTLHNTVNGNTDSRPLSPQSPAHHAPRSSTSSIEPNAQYYRDPEARQKLRVSLSPQKFDEALRFGFPAPDNKINGPRKSYAFEQNRQLPDFAAPSLDEKVVSGNTDAQRRTWALMPDPASPTREMTLKMTLTRPDLRSESPTAASFRDNDSLKPASLRQVDTAPQVGSPGTREPGLVKKIWRKVRRQ
ncbi:hypothetical protein P168DRAFT_307800 [Aspergillus campestris IBT 28561]|uniref:Pal1-domain-containing protein n=1 Tax=Aspergillus campestris (strain IBT 28561) TaxID=1392248 RepID=A0A2I1CRE7_ASPC2|nr:uncharacterized protein P168DRAFT_307800 [Aspergillus campestris IBT 28561]PKY00187.1 hypothetical protein P168DRAFT_307800 [Aspergillus campestris IBT 28561]